MPASRKSEIKKLSLGAMLIALGTVLIYIGAITEVLDLSLCAVACLITVFAVVEFSKSYAFMIYAATTILSFLILPNKFAAVAYAFMALYSILKALIERLSKVFAWIIKLLYFNTGIVAVFFVSKYILMLPDEGVASYIVLLLLGNAAFVLFDIAITRLITLYIFRLRSRLKLDRYLKDIRK